MEKVFGEQVTKDRISVVIPTFNRAHSVLQAVASATEQTHPPHEIIVVDDGSTDESSELILEQFPQVTLIKQANHGVSHARNRAIERASGDWIAFLDSDDTWFNHKLATQMSALKRQPDIKLCHCDEHWIRNGKRVNPMKKHRKHGGWIFEHCLPLCAISPSASLLHKSLFAELGAFDESLPACEDYDLWLRICSRYPVVYVDEALLSKTGGHDDQLSKKHWGMDRFRIKALAKLLRSGALDQQQYTVALDTLTTKLNILCDGTIKRGRTDEARHLKAEYADLIQIASL